VHSLSPSQRAAFLKAILALKSSGLYDHFVEVHHVVFDLPDPGVAHMVPAFGPWHRLLLSEFEKALRNIDPTVALPYWDWTITQSKFDAWLAAHPNTRLNLADADDIFADNFMGGDGQPVPFKDWKAWLPLDGASRGGYYDTKVLTRTIMPPAPALKPATNLPNQTDVRTTLAQKDYDVAPWNMGVTSFRNFLEGWQGTKSRMHNGVHVWIGGHMSTGISPNDPLFFLHHGMVDNLWDLWQTTTLKNLKDQSGITTSNFDADLRVLGYAPIFGGPYGSNLNDQILVNYNNGKANVRDVIDTATLGYQYRRAGSDGVGEAALLIPAANKFRTTMSFVHGSQKF